MQRKCKASAMKHASITEPQPFFCKDTHYISKRISLRLNLMICLQINENNSPQESMIIS